MKTFKALMLVLIFCALILSSCNAAATPEPSPTPAPPSATPTETSLPSATATATIPPTPTATPDGFGPSYFPTGVNPLTGMKAANPALLNRRPMLIKIANLPRSVRPQWGVSFADLVFEYYTEEGTTRFAAIFYGNDAATVGPIRSGRFIDAYLVRGYKAIFAFGFADPQEMVPFLNSDFADRLVVEKPGSPMKRVYPTGANYLTVGTAELSAYATQQGIENGRQELNGMVFKPKPPAGGQPLTQVFVHYSGSVYNRWDYDAASGKYLRFADNADVFSLDQREWYVPLTDKLTNKQVGFDNVVFMYVEHQTFKPGIYDIELLGSGNGFAVRDGQIYPIIWARDDYTSVVTLDTPDRTPFALKPGTTFFEVVGLNTIVDKTAASWRFNHKMP